MSENPWTRVSSRVVYENDWMRVVEDQVVRPDGNPGIYGVMESLRVATGVVALTEDDEVVLIGQYRYTLDCYSWEIVEGGADPGETPLAGAQRELAEEAGLKAERWTPLGGRIQLSNCITREVGYLFLAEGLSEVPSSPDPTEVLTVARVPFGDALARVDAGEIEDAMSIMGLLRAARLRG